MKEYVLSTVLLLVNIGFICLGGYGFSYLEKRGMEKRINRYLNISDQVQIAFQYLETGEFNDTDFYNNASVACTNGKTVPWTYGQSFNFAMSILTTVGWGVMSPSSYSSKFVVVIYALLGLPIYAMFIAFVKDKCANVFRKLCRVSHEVSWYWVPLSFTILTTIFLNIALNVGADIGRGELKKLSEKFNCTYIEPYKYWQEDATVWDGIYFSFITVSTIGFGATYLRLQECEDSSFDSVMFAIVGFLIFTILLGMLAHLFDVLSERSQRGISSLSTRLAKSVSASSEEAEDSRACGNRAYGRI